MKQLNYFLLLFLLVCTASARGESGYIKKLGVATAELHNSYWGAVVRSNMCIKRDKSLVEYTAIVEKYKKLNYPVLIQALDDAKIYFKAEINPQVNDSLDKGFHKHSEYIEHLNTGFLQKLENDVGKTKTDDFCKQWLALLRKGKLDLKERNPSEYEFVYKNVTP